MPANVVINLIKIVHMDPSYINTVNNENQESLLLLDGVSVVSCYSAQALFRLLIHLNNTTRYRKQNKSYVKVLKSV